MSKLEFKNWLNLLEAASLSGKLRSGSQDISNISLGKLGPYGTFGQVSDEPPVKSLVKQGVSAVLSGIGQSVKKKLSPTEMLPHLADLAQFPDSLLEGITLPLQSPTINGVDWISTIPKDSSRALKKISDSLASDEDNRIRKFENGVIDQGPNKFDLYIGDVYSDQEMGQQADQDKQYQRVYEYERAKDFTRNLCKILVHANMKNRPNYIELDNKYNLGNASTRKEIVKEFNDYYLLSCVFEYKKNKKGTGE